MDYQPKEQPFTVRGEKFFSNPQYIEVMKRRRTMLRPVKVTFGNGDHIKTCINGNKETIKEYYAIGKYFNLGHSNPDIEDNMQPVIQLEFLHS